MSEAVVPRLLPRLRQWLGIAASFVQGHSALPGRSARGLAWAGQWGLQGGWARAPRFFAAPSSRSGPSASQRKERLSSSLETRLSKRLEAPRLGLPLFDGSDVFGEPPPRKSFLGEHHRPSTRKRKMPVPRARHTLSPRCQNQACLPLGSVDLDPVVGLPGGIGSPRTSVIPTSVLLSLSWRTTFCLGVN